MLAKIESIENSLAFVEVEKDKIPPLVVQNHEAINVTDVRFSQEPFDSLESLWLEQKREIDVSLKYHDSVYFTAGPQMQFDQPRGTIARLCLPGNTEIEFWLHVETRPRGGDNLRNIRMVDFNSGKIYAESQNFDRKETEQSFNLYWRGKLPAGQPELTIQYLAELNYPLAETKPNSFFWGYQIMQPSYVEARVDQPAPCE